MSCRSLVHHLAPGLAGALAAALTIGVAAPAAAQDAPPVEQIPPPVEQATPPVGRAAPPVKRATPAAQGRTVVIERVVAVVNDAVILQSELDTRIVPLVADLQSIEDARERQRRRQKLVDQVLDEMVNEELIVQAAVEAKIEVEPKEIDAAIEEIKRQNDLDDEAFTQALKMQGYSMAGYRKDVRRQLLRMRAVNMLVRPKVDVTDEDLRARYDSMSRRTSSVSKVHLHHILISLPPQPTESQLAAAKARAAGVIEKVRAGAEFAAMAAEYSDDEGTKNAGGDLGWIEPGSIATEWEEVIFGMDAGEVRGPISGKSGLHVFYVADVKRDEVKPFDEVKESLRNELFRREMDKQTNQWLADLRKQAHVDRKL